ncbi:hypothetical protein OOZ53_17230 [Hoeflea sp. E7-10]|uniref:Tetratrico peptide repeat group 5 domain-containing protein n=1 Tax=Hoeflea poritis TaxID=2993659 RepID=A0ABT4VR07_9HYPH|nr:hypothetical protein [Hoeflea poritis]MDA4847106.1 hypothetical protein [Hoeflea poritis]
MTKTPTRTLAIALVAMVGCNASVAQENSAATDEAEPAVVQSRTERLDGYFLELKREAEPSSARRIADRIWAEWRISESATANQLMEWANDAIRDKRYFTALDLLDQVTVLMPEFAEGWNRRATLHYIMDNHAKSMADINIVLQLEPRHFGALMGMASILSAAGSDEAALGTYLKVLEVYPAMREAQEHVGQLSEELSGDEI